ncbi:uncharacterized protein LOC105867538 isoform X1 [Microcebus murinus]|uniref:uncharacterized protein LOC105867538 isoform X1 n=1 Tax=Microcebus murinus TaxID=30608 RepID=UPI003F6D0ED0
MEAHGLLLLPLLLLLPASVTLATSVNPCGPDMYQSENRCCRRCPAGHHVSRHCSTNHSLGHCTPCGPDTFMAHDNDHSHCRRCNQCREDQEPVTNCSATSDRQCQCKSGQFYCDSADCMESCFRCSKCPGGKEPLWPCNATADTVCPEPDEPGHANLYWLLLVLPVIFIISLVIWYCKKGKPVIRQCMAKLFKEESSEPGSSLSRSPCCPGPMELLLPGPTEPLLPGPTETLPPADADRDHPAPGTETTGPLEEENLASPPEAEAEAETQTSPGPSEDPGESPEGQLLAAAGSAVAPERMPHTCPPAARGPWGRTKATASLGALEQEYAQKYFLKDTSCNATNRIYYVIGREVPRSNWKMFMRFIQLGENEIEICEHGNQGNVMEQHHQMLLRWRNNLGKDGSVFKLMAALHQMELDGHVQNIINKLIAENILGRHPGTPR